MDILKLIFTGLSFVGSGWFLKWLLDHYFLSKKESIEISNEQNKSNDEISLKLMSEMRAFVEMYQKEIIKLNVKIISLEKSNEDCERQYKELNNKYTILQNDFNKLNLAKIETV